LICTAIQYYTPPPIKEARFAGYENLDPPAEDEGLPELTEDMEKEAKRLSGIDKADYVVKKVKSVVDKRGCSTQLNRCKTREHVLNYLNSGHITEQFPDVKKTQQMADEIRGKLESTSEGSLEHTKNIHQTTLSKCVILRVTASPRNRRRVASMAYAPTPSPRRRDKASC